MSSNEHHWDDERLEALSASTDHDTPPPDVAFLGELRARSTAAFEAHVHDQAELTKRSNKMTVLATRALAVCAAAAILVASWFFLPTGKEADVTLGAVLAKLSQAESIHLTVVAQGKQSDVWVKQASRLRWNRPDGTYQIDDGKQLWVVDEKANQATSQPSVYFGKNRSGLNWLRILGLNEPKGLEDVLANRPTEQITSDGVLCDVYRWTATSGEGKLQCEALVDAQEQALRSLAAGILRDGRVQPHSSIVVAATNQPVAEELFVIADTLTVDGRIGKVTDVQGLVTVRPVMGNRWTPVPPQLVLKPGDWVRTDLRGANAVTLRLIKQTRVTLGPGTLVELVSPDRLQVLSGEVKVVTDTDAPLTLVGPQHAELVAQGTRVYRLDADTLIALDKEPAWLAGFEGATAHEAIGSLVAKIDGRDVPLTVGYHKVTVDIRDQIARTVIEESFVNHTPSQLEGVFYFPLPQDASISGFGMWIGNELVEADVVEKQRATGDLRDDPAREARSGPVGMDRWQSVQGTRLSDPRTVREADQDHLHAGAAAPRESLPVQLFAAERVAAATSAARTGDRCENQFRRAAGCRRPRRPTPLASIRPTFGARRVRCAGVHADARLRGRRGSRREPVRPGGDSASDVARTATSCCRLCHQQPRCPRMRDMLPDGEPLRLVDSGRYVGIDGCASRVPPRRSCVGAILSSLSATDSFNLATCDVDCRWVFDEPVPADATEYHVRPPSDGRLRLARLDRSG